MNHKFKIGEEIYIVQGYKVVKCLILRIVTTETKEKESFEYIVSPLTWIEKDKQKEKAFTEAYMVKTLEEAKASALLNWENTYSSVKGQLEALTEESYNYEK